MRIFNKLLFGVVTLCAIGFAACNETPIDEPVNTELSVTLEQLSLEIDGNGGTYDIGYTITNGINGIDIVAEADVEWISNIRTAENRLYFDCDKNFTNKEREGVIAVRYPNYSTQTIKIKQAASDALTFEMEICDIKTTSCSSIKTTVPAKFLDINLEAFNLGYNL